MPNITFSNSEYKDKTVYAVAGSHTETVLKIALENKIPINFDCENGDCGSCVINVKSLAEKQRMGNHLTDKEKAILQELGKLSKAEIEDAYVNDRPPSWRLACQLIVRDEDLLVTY